MVSDIAGEFDGVFNGYNWTGSEWQPDPTIVSGVGDVGMMSAPTVFNKDGAWYLIAGEDHGMFNGYNWTGSEWQPDPVIVSGLGFGSDSAPTVFYRDGLWYLISGTSSGDFRGYGIHPRMGVSKTIWDPANGIWTNDVTAISGDTLKFRCIIQSGQFNLTNITVSDVLPDILNYSSGNAMVNGVPHEPVQTGDNAYEWNLSELLASDFITVEFDATAVKAGTGTGIQNATAWCEQTSEWVDDEDSVSVSVTHASIEVVKTVWDSINETWVGEITAPFNDTLCFRCVVNNTGPYNLMNVSVVDSLPYVLDYSSGSAMVNSVPQEPVQIADNEYEWNISELATDHNITIEFDARAARPGTGTSIQHATAWCEQAREWVQDEDNVNVRVTARDLTVSSIYTIPSPVLFNQLCDVNVIVANMGDLDAGAFNVSLYIKGETIGEKTVSDLEGSEFTTVQFGWTPTEEFEGANKHYTITAVADCDDDALEIDEDNNELAKVVEVVDIGKLPCWNDTFDDETKIAEKNYVIVEDGDVEIDLDNVKPNWRPSSVGCGLYEWYKGYSQGVCAIAYNLRGDDKWIAIMDKGYCCGSECAPCMGFYWDGAQWVKDNSLVSGLPSTISWHAIASNITGDGSWNIITSSSGYYWDGDEWVSDPSLSAGLEGRVTTIAFNITGDGKWNAMGDSKGYYWNGTQWINDSRLGGLEEWVQVGFNMTGDGRWNAISGDVPSNHFASNPPRGWYWNGTQWVEDISLVTGFPGVIRFNKPVIAFNITGDGRWNVIAARLSGFDRIFQGYELFYPAELTSDVVSLPADNHWLLFFTNHTTPNGTEITYEVLDEWNNTLMEVTPGQSITDITDAKIRLFAELRVNNPYLETPVLHDWRICCVEGLPGGVLKEKKRLTFDPNSSTSPSVAADSEGSVHVVWTEDRSDWQIHFMKLAANGTVLINETVLPASGVDPTILIDPDDNLHVTFDDHPTASLPDAYYMKLDNVGEVLIAPKKILSGDGYPTDQYPWRRAFTIDSAGDIHAVEMYVFCIRCGNGICCYDTIRYIKFDNEGQELLNTTLVSFMIKPAYGWSAEPCDAVSIATDSDGSSHVVYNRGTAGTEEQLDIYHLKVDSSGAVLEDMRLTMDSYESRYPVVCTDATGNAHIIWGDNRSGWDVYYTKLGSNGDVLINNKQITFEGSTDSFGGSSIDTESGVVHAAWSDGLRIYYTALDTSGNIVVDRMLLSPPSAETTASNPCIGAVSDGSHLVWDEKREHDAEREIYYARLMLPSNRVILMSPPDQWTPVNVNATYPIGILSTMSNTETFNLTLDNLDDADVAELSDSTITLDPYTPGEIILNVTDAIPDEYRVTVSAISQSNPAIRADATITTSVVAPAVDLIITTLDAYHNDTGYPPYFNLSNEISIEVKNTGTANAGTFNVSLYIGDEFFGKQTVSGLGLGKSTSIQFIRWMPEGTDCEDGGSSRLYTLKAIADCDGDIAESNEANNESTAEETVYWAGWSADEQLNMAANGTIRGGMIYTTGDGGYVSSVTSTDIHYDITLPEGASVEHARLYVYYTWCKDDYAEMKVSIGGTEVPSVAEYNDRPCDSPAIGFNYPYGTYVYNLTPYVGGTGAYTVTVERVGSSDFCIAAPGMLILYEDDTEPEREYFILEGADILEGGRRGGAGYLSLEECTNNAAIPGEMDADKVNTATLGMVLPWGGAGGGSSHYWFSDNYLGDGSIMGGYGSLYQRTVDGMSMHVGASGSAQIGVNVSDVTGYIASDNNTVTFGDDGDSMMVANAFLLVEYGAGMSQTPFLIYGEVNDTEGTPVNNPDMAVKNMNTGGTFTVETDVSSSFYQVVTGSKSIHAGDMLQFTCGGTVLEYEILPAEMDAGALEQNITWTEYVPPPEFWESCEEIASGLSYIGDWAAPAVFSKDGTWYLISGNTTGMFSGFNWNGSGWQSNTGITAGLGDVGGDATPAVFSKDGTWYLIAGELDGEFNGYNWTGSAWQADPAIVSGLSGIGTNSAPAVFSKDGTWYMIAGERYGNIQGYNWTGSAWQADDSMTSGLENVSSYTHPMPTVFYESETWYLIFGEYYGEFGGFNWTGSSWQADDAIISGLGAIGMRSSPAAFEKDGTWYLIAGDKFGLFCGYKHPAEAPEIVSYAPETPVNDAEGAVRTFNVTVSQMVNVSWLIDGTLVQFNDTVTEASYTNGSAVVGYWNVSAIAMNENGTDMQTWWWNVTQAGICGDVNDDGDVDMTDVMTLWYDIADYPYVDAYTVSNAWAADVNCDGELDMTDVMTLWYDIADYPYVGAYEVNCCG
jgi:uncharacterized repeat protein (TIGR01451 family)